MSFLTDCEVCAFVADLNDFDLVLSKSPSLYSRCSLCCSSQTGFILWSISIQLIACFVFWWRQNNCFSTGCFSQMENTLQRRAGQSQGYCCVQVHGEPLRAAAEGASRGSSWHHPRSVCGWQEHQMSFLWWVKMVLLLLRAGEKDAALWLTWATRCVHCVEKNDEQNKC